MSLAFFISGHGFGHASRQIEIINAVARRAPDARILIRSSAPQQLFERTLKAAYDLDPMPADTGVVQIDSLHPDERVTVEVAREFYSTFVERAEAEAERLRTLGVHFVVADAPPLACEAAARAGIPSVVISNFTWDWIYAAYPGFAEHAPEVIPTIQRAYRNAEAAWRLPLHGGFETFRTIRDLPFVARHAKHTREETRERLRLPVGQRLALSSFGGYSAGDIDFDRLDSTGDWTVVITGNDHQTNMPRGTQFVFEPELYALGLRYEDLVAACDVVVTKPGYGIISECIANPTAMVYTARGRFAEYDVLAREMPKYLKAHYIDQESLKAGRWRAALDVALDAPAPPQRPATNGADVVAELLTTTSRR